MKKMIKRNDIVGQCHCLVRCLCLIYCRCDKSEKKNVTYLGLVTIFISFSSRFTLHSIPHLNWHAQNLGSTSFLPLNDVSPAPQAPTIEPQRRNQAINPPLLATLFIPLPPQHLHKSNPNLHLDLPARDLGSTSPLSSMKLCILVLCPGHQIPTVTCPQSQANVLAVVCQYNQHSPTNNSIPTHDQTNKNDESPPIPTSYHTTNSSIDRRSTGTS